MKFLQRMLHMNGLSELDRQIEKFRNLRDSYHEANTAYFGKELAEMLNS
ncbi:hypothetical protein [Geobacter sp.]|nr:hypothetical protein [Geobacter sp.]